MSLAVQITNGFAAVSTAIRALRTVVTGTPTGNLTTLTTTDKTSIIAAINEVNSYAGGLIDDVTPSTTKVYSSSKTDSQISAAISAVVNGAGAAYDTLLEIQNQLQSDDSDISGILTALGKRVRVDAAQSFTAGEQLQGRQNIDAVSTAALGLLDARVVVLEGIIAAAEAADYAGDFNTALAA